jgi:hypothetical protein
MDQFTNHLDVITGDSSGSGRTTARGLMNPIIDVLIKLGILKEDLDYHFNSRRDGDRLPVLRIPEMV